MVIISSNKEINSSDIYCVTKKYGRTNEIGKVRNELKVEPRYLCASARRDLGLSLAHNL